MAYIVLVLTGAFLPNHFLVSFEMMILFTTPTYLTIIAYNIWQYIQTKEKMILVLLGAWALLLLTMVAYYYYLVNGYTEQLWAKGIWFSANDVLHVAMIIWIVYVWKIVGKFVGDRQIKKQTP